MELGGIFTKNKQKKGPPKIPPSKVPHSLNPHYGQFCHILSNYYTDLYFQSIKSALIEKNIINMHIWVTFLFNKI